MSDELDMPLAKVGDLHLPDGSAIVRAQHRGGQELWAVRQDEQCLNKNGEWTFEPSPSQRSEEFLEQCRWPTRQDAYRCWEEKVLCAKSQRVQSAQAHV